MAQDLKISELARNAFNVDTSGTNINIDPITAVGKFIIPSLVVGEGNKSLDLGLMFSLMKQYLISAVETAVDNYMAGNGGSSSGGSSGGGGSYTPSEDITQLRNQIVELRNAVYNPTNYPTTYIKLKSGNTESEYQIPTGLGQTTANGSNNPIIINTTSTAADNFQVTIVPSSYTISNGTASANIELNINGAPPYAGGTVGTIVVKTYFTTSNGQYETSQTINDFASTTLSSSNPSIPTQNLTMTVSVPNNTSVSQVSTTCSVAGKNLGTSGVNVGGTIRSGIGTIKL